MSRLPISEPRILSCNVFFVLLHLDIQVHYSNQGTSLNQTLSTLQ